jgi:hypothetical protein
MRRRVLMLASLICAGIVALFAFVFWWPNEPPNRINNESYELIRPGMSEIEVEEILGGPYGQYFRGKVRGAKPGNIIGPNPLIFRAYEFRKGDLCQTVRLNGDLVHDRKAWIADGLGIWVYFDEDGVVIDKEAHHLERDRESLREIVKRWIGW